MPCVCRQGSRGPDAARATARGTRASVQRQRPGQAGDRVFRRGIGGRAPARHLCRHRAVVDDAAALRILVVDDQPMVLKSVGAVLSALGHQPVLYGDPEEACRDFGESPADIDLAIVDLGMNPINGLELAEALRSLRKDLPVIMVTTEGGERTVMEAISLGAKGFIRKPLTAAQMVDALAKVT